MAARPRRHRRVGPSRPASVADAALPRSRLHIFEDSGHYPFIEERAAFLSTLAEWLEECR